MANTDPVGLMLKPATFVLQLQQGATFTKTFIWETGLPGAEEPVKFAGYAAWLQIRDGYGGEVIAEFSSDGSYANDAAPKGVITLGATDGSITLDMDPAITDLLDFDSAVYDLKMRDSLGAEFFLIRGPAKLVRRVTK